MSIILKALKKLDHAYSQHGEIRYASGLNDPIMPPPSANTLRSKTLLYGKFSLIIIFTLMMLLLIITMAASFHPKTTTATPATISSTPTAKPATPAAPIAALPASAPPESKPQPTPKAKPRVSAKTQVIRNDAINSDTLYTAINQAMLTGHDNEALAILASQQRNRELYLQLATHLANSLLIANRLNAAINILHLAVAAYPNDVAAHQLLSLAYFKNSQYQQTVDTLLDLHPTLNANPSYYALLAAGYLKTKAYYNAKDLYEALVQLDSNNPDYSLGLAITYQALQQNALARNYYQNALNTATSYWASRSFATQQLNLLGE